MSSVLALVSKAIYEQLVRNKGNPGYPKYVVGEVVPLDRYTSKHPAFEELAPGDSIFLVTVRPEGPVLVAILDRVKRVGGDLVGATNRTPLTMLETQLQQLRLADGKGITASLDKLGMSLQTPRLLAAEDVALLRGATPKHARRSRGSSVAMKVVEKRPRPVAGQPALRGGKLGSKAQTLLAQVYKNPDDRGLREVLADQLLQDQHVWGELISLQLANPKRHAKRITQIFKQYARDIVGDIANVAARDTIELVDGFPHLVMCAKSKTFTSAEERHSAALAPQWATVRTVQFTGMMTGVFIRELLHNPASANLTRLEDGTWSGIKVRLARAKAPDPWEIVNPRCERILDGLPDAELARIPTPAKPALVAELQAARARRAKAKTKADPRPARKRKR